MPITRKIVDRTKFNDTAELPFELRLQDFEAAMQDAYDFFYDVNSLLIRKGLQRLEDMLRAANMTGVLTDMLTASLARHSRSLTVNGYPNGHPDLIVRGVYPLDRVQSGSEGVEIKTTVKRGGAVDTHGARDQWMAAFVYYVDKVTEPAIDRRPTQFGEIYITQVEVADFRRNARGELGTRTATLHKQGIAKLRQNWVYRDLPL